jgi:hypothetical protein
MQAAVAGLNPLLTTAALVTSPFAATVIDKTSFPCCVGSDCNALLAHARNPGLAVAMTRSSPAIAPVRDV